MAKRARSKSKGAASEPAAPAPKQSALRSLEDPPLDDSLAGVNWMQRALVAMASDVKGGKLAEDKKRAEMLKIADRMAKLRDTDRIFLVEEALRLRNKRRDEPKSGPEMTSAAKFDEAAGPIVALNGRRNQRGLS